MVQGIADCASFPVRSIPLTYTLYCSYNLYLCTELGKLLYKSNILHITSYFYQEVIYYSYILLHQRSNFVILLHYFITFKSINIM